MSAEVLLSAKGLTKRFGGLAAVNDVSVDLWRDRIHAVIGPNGAGKSTLTNLLSGDLPPSFAPFTVWENVRLAAQSRDAQQPWNPLRWIQAAARSARANERANRAIELAGLSARRNVIAGASSHGEQRQLEIAMTLATEPQVLLLDEPLAGMGVAEAERMVELLLKLKKDHAMLLVEHDIDAIFTLADHLTVMVNGQVIASGAPAVVRADRGVQAAYLGEEH